MSSTNASLLGDYTPGASWLHRLRAGAKLGVLMFVGLMVVLVRQWWFGMAFVVLALALLAVAGVGVRRVLRTLRPLIILLVVLVAYSLWRASWQVALEQAADLVALILLATVVTTTTAVDDILDVVVRTLGPLRRLGVNPERVGLAFSLMIRSVPLVLTIARETRDAARARGLERNPRVWLTPFVIRAIAHARDTGDALHARGLGDD